MNPNPAARTSHVTSQKASVWNCAAITLSLAHHAIKTAIRAEIAQQGRINMKWPDGTPKSQGNAFDWRNMPRENTDAWTKHLEYVARGKNNASKGQASAGLETPVNQVWQKNITAFSGAKTKLE